MGLMSRSNSTFTGAGGGSLPGSIWTDCAGWQKITSDRRNLVHLDAAAISLSPSEGERAGVRGSFLFSATVSRCAPYFLRLILPLGEEIRFVFKWAVFTQYVIANRVQ